MAYGLQLGDENGVTLDEDETFTQVVDNRYFDYNYSGTVSVPNFDDTKGMFFLTMGAYVWKKQYTSNPILQTVSAGFPSLNWNNSAKTLTVAPASLPSGFLGYAPRVCDYWVTFIHYK